MAVFTYQDSDLEILRDFATDSDDLSRAAESHLLALEQSPEDAELLNALFRTVHTIKGNGGLLGLDPLVQLLQSLESILDAIRDKTWTFEPILGDLTLLILDRCLEFIRQLSESGTAEFDQPIFDAVVGQLEHALTLTGYERTDCLGRALTLLDPSTTQWQETAKSASLFDQIALTPSNDLQFIHSLAEQTQQRADFWQGRLNRVVLWLLALNDYAGSPVEPEQLVVAACMHDLAMALMPSAVIHARSPLTGAERQVIQNHVHVASRMTSSFAQWHTAKQILDQHQENFDGSGYPLGLQGHQICTGAQMLAVVHAFEAITHGYSRELSRRRPLMRAVMELNRFAGEQFNPEWVQAFMEVTRADEPQAS
ncbi:HD domain-containing phosphohydrolase [Reinekea blandensis]|uniref:HD-GYP domain n=1 Tax=Reinekea blandensis MED297 TaxID=314283 RepID=A4BI60_9GAMM|nr:HD domain-containing phosphohydrolase [Reinekea blandensis]EAR08203.1 HD-GYP domain [Reinekea sp. MED297] [Reinekea blandensis MED297]